MVSLTLTLLLFLLAWPLLLFPVAMKLWGRKGKPAPAGNDDNLPPVTLLICAHNEERVIGAKMDNCLCLEYPSGQLSVVVVNDGSSDGTADVVRRYISRGIRLIDRPVRRGKVANLNEVTPTAETPLVAFSDANVMYDPPAIRRLAAHFRDPEVGGATGRVVLHDSAEPVRAAESQYYSLEWAVHAGSTAIHSMAGCDGAMYMLRRELFQECPPDTLIEDFVQALALVRQGRRMVFEPEALGWERGPQSLAEEYRRKVRIAAGAAQALMRGDGWPAGAPARFWLVWASHKLLRWLAPVTALAALALAVATPEYALSQLALIGAGISVALASLRFLTGWRSRLLDAPFYLLFGLAAGFEGLVRGASGGQDVLWNKASR